MGEDGAADRLAAHRHVGDLRAHADHEGEIKEVPIVRLGPLPVGENHSAALSAVLVVVFVRVVQREYCVRERPGQHDRQRGKDQLDRLAWCRARRAQQREDGTFVVGPCSATSYLPGRLQGAFSIR